MVSPTQLFWRYHSLPLGHRAYQPATKYYYIFVFLNWKQFARRMEFLPSFDLPTCLAVDSSNAWYAGTVVSVHCICTIGAILTWHTEAFINVCKNIWWCNDIETLSVSTAFCEWNPPVTKGFLLQWTSDAEHRCCIIGLVCVFCLINSRVIGNRKRQLDYVKQLLSFKKLLHIMTKFFICSIPHWVHIILCVSYSFAVVISKKSVDRRDLFSHNIQWLLY